MQIGTTPYVLGTLPHENGPFTLAPRTSGSWREGELRVVSYPGACLVVLGQCFAADSVVRGDLDRTLTTGCLRHLTRWTGSYAVLLITHDYVAAFTDLAGQYPLFYHLSRDKTVIGSDAEATARAAGLLVVPDTLSLSAAIACPDVPMLTSGRSVLANVIQLDNGHALRITRDRKVERWAYEDLAPVAGTSFADAADQLREALTTAVGLRARANGPLTADFSGGIDSTSLAFLALSHRRNAPLPVYTYHQPGTSEDDLVNAKSHAQTDDRVALTIVRGSDRTLTYQGLDDVAAPSLPNAAVVVQARTLELLNRVSADGGGVHLGGEGGDALFAPPPAYLGDLARRRAFRRLALDCADLTQTRHIGSLRLFSRSVLQSRTSVKRSLRTLAGQLNRPSDTSPEWFDAIAWWPRPGMEARWLTADARGALATLIRARAEEHAHGTSMGTADLGTVQAVRKAGAVQHYLDGLGRRLGIWPQAPFLDNAVIRASLMLPAHQRAHPNTPKPLLSAALTGLVPRQVLARTTKGNYSAEDYLGVRRSVVHLRERVTRSPLTESGVIDPRAVIGSLSAAVAGERAPFSALNWLLAADLWMRAIKGGRRDPG